MAVHEIVEGGIEPRGGRSDAFARQVISTQSKHISSSCISVVKHRIHTFSSQTHKSVQNMQHMCPYIDTELTDNTGLFASLCCAAQHWGSAYGRVRGLGTVGSGGVRWSQHAISVFWECKGLN